MDRVYNLRKNNSKLCFQVDSYYNDDVESLKNSQESEEFKLKDRCKSSLSNSKLQNCFVSNSNRRSYQARSLQEDQRTSCQSTSYPSEEISSPSMTTNNNSENKKSKKTLKNQEKLIAPLQKCIVKYIQNDKITINYQEQSSSLLSLPQINLPVNCSNLHEYSVAIQQQNKLISIFSSLRATHLPLYAISNKNQQIVTLALNQILPIDNFPHNHLVQEVFKKVNGFKNSYCQNQIENTQIFTQKDSQTCPVKESSKGDKSTNIQQKSSTNQRKKNKTQSKYIQQSHILQFAEKNKQRNFIVIENIKYQSQEDSTENKQIHVHFSHYLLKSLGWDIQEFVEQISFSGLPEIAGTNNYESLISSLTLLLAENTEQSSQCGKSIDTNDTSNFSQEKEIQSTEICLINKKGEAIPQQCELKTCGNGLVFFKLSKINEESQEKSQLLTKSINMKRYLSKTEIDYLATHFFREESLGYDVNKICKYRAISQF